MKSRMDQAREDAAFRRTKAERVKDKISTGAVRKLDKDGLSKQTRDSFKVWDRTASTTIKKTPKKKK